MLFLVAVVWTNLSGFGLGAQSLTYDDVALPRFAVALVGAFAVWLVLGIMLMRGNELLCDPTWWLLGGLAGWAIVSALFAKTTLVWLGQSERLEGVVTLVLYALLFGAGLQLGRSKRYVRRFAMAFVAGASILALHGLLQTFKLDPTNYGVGGYSFYMGSAFSSLGNPNFLAGLLVLSIPISVGLAFTTESGALKAVWWVSAVLSLGALYATYSQGAWLAAVVQLAIGVSLWLSGRQTAASGSQAGGEAADVAPDAVPRGTASSERRVMSPALIAALIVMVGVIVIAVVTGIATSRGLRLWGSSLSETGSGRVLLMQTVMGAVAAKPVLGWGPDNYLAAFRLERPDQFVKVFGEMPTNNNAHNWVLQYAATLGILGGLLLAAALALGLWRSRPRTAALNDDGSEVLAAAIWVGAVGFGIQMMLNVAMLASTVPFWLLLGAISAARANRLKVPRMASVATVGACAVLLVGAVFGSGLFLTADYVYNTSRTAYNGEGPGDAVALAEKASRLNPLAIKYARGVGQARSKVLNEMLSQEGSPEAQVRAQYETTKAGLDHALELSPNDYAALSWTAAIQSATGTYLSDPTLLAAAGETAKRAEALDLTHWSVVPLLRGERTSGAVRVAASAPGLP